MSTEVTLRPYLVGTGPAEFSTCLSLDRVRVIVWDTNLWYRRLGIPTDATRRQIKEAYQRRGGHRSPRLTYITKMLLQPDVRRRYDATPLGSMFFDDEVEGWMRNARVQHVSLLRQQGRVAEAEAIEAEEFDPVLDTEASDEETASEPPDEAVWPWSFYLWGSECQDLDRLRRWQQHLASAFGRRGAHINLSVGFSGGMAQPAGVTVIGYRTVAFLAEDEVPNEALADALASRVVNHINGPRATSMER